jgi:hypothetical protein
MDIVKALGKAFLDIRSSKAIVQEFFDDISSRRQIYRMEKGEVKVTVAYLDKVSVAMNVHPLTVLTLAYLNKEENMNFQDLQKLVQKELFQIDQSLTTPGTPK